jgi:hypothetical protein
VTVKKPVKAVAPRKAASRKVAPLKASKTAPPRKPVPLTGDALDAAILRHLRTRPNEALDLAPLATELDVDPMAIQLAVERLHNRRMVVAPFIEPGRAGGAELTAVGLRWLIAREGGKPLDTPVAFQPAKGRVRAQDEAARLPRAQVYGVKR